MKWVIAEKAFSLEILAKGNMARLLCSCQLFCVETISGTTKTYFIVWNFQTVNTFNVSALCQLQDNKETIKQ